MATNLATAYVSIVPSMQGVQGQLMRGLVPAVGPAADKAGREGGKRMGSAFTDSLKRAAAFGAATFGFAAIVGGMRDAITKAGDLEQSIGGVSAVFKANAATIDQWSRGSAKNLGLSRNSYNEFATLIGAQLKNAGVSMDELAPKTDSLITIGADLASMFGGSVNDAIAAVSSTLKGEMDPIQAYGITMTAASVDAEAAAMGFEKVGDSFDTQAKTAATMSLIMKQAGDAQGNFAREANTYAGQVARLGASWDDLKAKVGELFLPAMTTTVTFLSGTVVPVLTEVAGGVRAFREAWIAADGDITSSGFAGFMERSAFAARTAADVVRDVLLPPLQTFGGWVRDNAVTIGSVAAILATMTAGFYANTAAVAIAGAATAGYGAIIGGVQSRLLTARIAVMYFNAALLANPVGLVVAALAGLVVAIVLAWKHSETFRAIVTGAWEGIRAAASAVGGWLTGTLFPAVMVGVRAVGDVFRWLQVNVVQPVWYGIRVAVAVVGAILLTIWDGLAWAVRNTLGAVFVWLRDSVILPVWNAIRSAISAAWTFLRDVVFRPLVSFLANVVAAGFRNFRNNVSAVWTSIRSFISAAWTFIRDSVFRPIVGFLRDALGPAFRFLYDRVILPVWNSVRDKISAVWSWVRDRAFRPMADFAKNTLGGAFRTGVDAITKAWDRVKKAVSGPVDFVINAVINKGLIENFNTIARKFKIDELPNVEFKGFREGGRTGGSRADEVRGLVHGREFVANESRTSEADRLAPGFLDDYHRHGFAAAAAKHFNPANAAPGAFLPSYGVGSWTGGLRSAIFASGRMNVAGAAPGYDMTGALNMLDKATSVKVARGPAGLSNSVTVSAGPIGAWWAGYQEGNTVRLNNLVAGGMPMRSKRVLLAHELGHALGLPHNARMHGGNGAQSMMNYDNMYAHASVTGADVRALSAIYGGTGFASGGGASSEDERPGLLSRLGDWLKKTIGFDALLKKIPGGEFMKDVVEGAMKSAWKGFQDWTAKALDAIKPANLLKSIGSFLGIGGGAAAGGRPTVFDGGGWLEKSAAPQLTWHRENKPDAVLTNSDYHLLKAAATNGVSSDRRDAPLVGTLQALNVDEAIRKLRDTEKKKEALNK